MARQEHQHCSPAFQISVLQAEVERMEREVVILNAALEVLRRRLPNASSRPVVATPRGAGRLAALESATPRRRARQTTPKARTPGGGAATTQGGLTSEQLAKAMGSNVASICVWRKLGMPYTREGRLFLHDLEACRAWRDKNHGQRGRGGPAKAPAPRKASRRSTPAPAIDGGTASSATPDADVAADEPAPEAAGTIGGTLTADGGLFVPGPSEKAHHTEPPADQAQRRVLRMFARVNRPLLMTEARDELQIAAIPTIEVRALLAIGFLEPGTLNGRPAYRITTAGRLAAAKSRAGAIV